MENLLISPVSSMMVSARICPIPGTVLRKLNSALSLTLSVTVLSKISICPSAHWIMARLALTARAKSGVGQQVVNLLCIERLDSIRPDRTPGVTCDQIL